MIFSIFINFLMFFNLLSIGLPIILDLIIIGFLFKITNKNKIIIFNTNLIFLIVLFSLTKFNINLDKSDNYYRGHEKFYENKFSYKKNINEKINVPYGDLIAVDICLDKDKTNNLKVKRTQKFITDKYGYRNSKVNFEESNFILVGDSQVSGSGLTDELILSSQLNKITNFKISNLSIGGAEPIDYKKMIDLNFSKFNENAKIIIFYYEGNDFLIQDKSQISKKNLENRKNLKLLVKSGYERLERNKDKFFLEVLNYDNFFYKKIRPKAQRLYFRLLAKWTKTCPVKYETIGNNLVGFYWLENNINDTYQTYIIDDPKILKRIHKIYLIPTKFKVYENFLNGKDYKESAKFIFLKESYEKKNIEVEDLTQTLRKNAINYLKKNEYLYFRDDTHLNQNGTLVIAEFIKKSF